QRSVALSRGSWARFPTVLINLNQTPDVLLNNMKKDTRYEIRRADSRDRVVCYFWDNVDPGLVSRFTSFYAQHSTLKAFLQGGQIRLKEFARTNAVALSEVRDRNGEALVWHAYYYTKERARLLYSVSQREAGTSSQRTSLGRANRFLH